MTFMNKNWKHVLLLSSLLMVMSAEVSAMSDDASTLRHRQLALFETDSVEPNDDLTLMCLKLS